MPVDHTTSSLILDAIASGLPTSLVVTSSDGATIPSGTAIVDARAFRLSSQPEDRSRSAPEHARIEIHLIAEKAGVPEVQEAISRLIEVALSDTGQSRICADFLLSWWDTAEHGAFAVSDLFSLDSALARDVATVVTYLSRCSAAIYADSFGHQENMAAVAARWRAGQTKRPQS